MKGFLAVINRVLFSPITKSIVAVLSVIVSGVLCSALVVEITGKDGKIDWHLVKTASTSKWILLFFFLSVIYVVISAVEENNYRKKIDDKFLENFVNSEGLDTLAKEVTAAIKSGDKVKLESLVDMKETLINSLGRKS